MKLRGGERENVRERERGERERERELTFQDPGKCVGKLFWPRSISPVTNLGFWLHSRKRTKIISLHFNVTYSNDYILRLILDNVCIFDDFGKQLLKSCFLSCTN